MSEKISNFSSSLKNVGPIGSAGLPFTGWKQTDRHTSRICIKKFELNSVQSSLSLIFCGNR